jgi:hypothetical protein
MRCPFRSVVVDGSIDCRPDDCAVRSRCLQPDRWQIAQANPPRAPQEQAPKGYEPDGPWEPFGQDHGLIVYWKRPLREVKL